MKPTMSVGPSPRWGGAAVCLLLLGTTARAQHDPPRLLVVLAVDQMRADYLQTYGQQWHAGLRRLVDDGAWFENAAYPYLATVTCAGHATIATGTFPSRHGMIRNSWWDRTRGVAVTCTTDASEAPIAYGGTAREQHSADLLEVPTLADVLRADPARRTRVVSLSLKPRSAITLAGDAADAIAWFDAGNTWATSTAYSRAPVTEVQRFVAANPVEDTRSQVWDRLLSEDSYLYEDDGRGEQPPAGWTSRFPHPFGDTVDADFYRRWRASPFSDGYLTRMALALLDGFELGQADHTDYLAIGYSALDYVGHRFGPRSHEVQDVLARLDVALGELFDALDARVGRGRYVVALSADHGVSPIPERAVAEGIDAGRTMRDSLPADLEALLTERHGPGPYVASLEGWDLYFVPGVYETLLNRPGDFDAVLGLIKRAPGMWRVYRADQLRQGNNTADPITRAVGLSFFEGRSGDLILIPKPYWIGQGYAATHGSPYHYDTRIPVVFYGAGIAPGHHSTASTPADIAPTLAHLAGVTLPEPDGRILIEALAQD